MIVMRPKTIYLLSTHLVAIGGIVLRAMRYSGQVTLTHSVVIVGVTNEVFDKRRRT